MVLPQGLPWGCSQVIWGCSQLKLRLGNPFFKLIDVRGNFSCSSSGLDHIKKECNIFYNLILAVTVTSVIVYWSYRPTLVKYGRGLHNGVNTRRGSILEVGHCIGLGRICSASIWLHQKIVRKCCVTILKYHVF